MRITESPMAVFAVILATGCLEKPAPWVPEGSGNEEDRMWTDGRVAGGDGQVGSGKNEVGTAIETTGDGFIVADVGDVFAEGMMPDGDASRREFPFPPDADVPDALYTDGFPGSPEGRPMLVPRVFIGRSSGGEFTLIPIGMPGLKEGVLLSGGSWKLFSWHGGLQ